MEGNQEDRMKKLWKDTFHDSDEYINLVFNSYYNAGLAETEYDGDQLISALLGIPYNFLFSNNGGGSPSIMRGLYLCGLATDPAFRKRGIMNKLLERINKRAKELNFDFTFLIPANRGLRKYYQDRGYVDSFFRQYLNFSSKHTFISDMSEGGHESMFVEVSDYSDLNQLPDAEILMDVSSTDSPHTLLEKSIHGLSSLQCSEFRDDDLKIEKVLKDALVNTEDVSDIREGINKYKNKIINILNFLIKEESKIYKNNIHHNLQDWCNIILENIQSNSKFIIGINDINEISSIVFYNIQNYGKIIDISGCYYSSEYFKKLSLQFLKNKYHEYSLRIFKIEDNPSTPKILDKYYLESGNYDTTSYLRDKEEVVAGPEWESYGMIKILNFSEILKFTTNYKEADKYQILESDDNVSLINVEKGDRTSMTKKEFSELLCRKPPVHHDYVRDAFGFGYFNPGVNLLLE